MKLFTQDATLQVCPFESIHWKHSINTYTKLYKSTLQEMILDLVPLICISNMTMAAGMVSIAHRFIFCNRREGLTDM